MKKFYLIHYPLLNRITLSILLFVGFTVTATSDDFYSYSTTGGVTKVSLTATFKAQLNKATGGSFTGTNAAGTSITWTTGTALPAPATTYNSTVVTDMSGLFSNCGNMTSLNLSNFNTANVTNMNNMFQNCTDLTALDLSSFNTAAVTDMSYMFYDCSDLLTLNVSSFNTESVTNMSCMFQECSDLTNLSLTSFVTANVTNMSNMFRTCESLLALNLSSFVTENVTNMSGMFYDCSDLKTLTITGFNTANVTNMREMFYECSDLRSINLTSFNTSAVTDMDHMFYECESLQTLDISNFNTSAVTDMSYMFYDCDSLVTLDLSNFVTTAVTNMSYMFNGNDLLQTLDLGSFITTKVIDMSFMFQNCSRLSNLDISRFNTSNVLNIDFMFDNTASANTTGTPYNFYVANAATVTAMNSNSTDISSTKLVIKQGYYLKIGDTGYATLCLPFNAIVPTGATVYYASSVSSDIVNLMSITDAIIPLNEGVVVKAAQGKYLFAATSAGSTTITNLLTGVTQATALPTHAYTLTDNSTAGICFYKAAEGTAISEYTAYLQTNSDASLLAITFDGVSGITNVYNEGKDDDIYYNLRGIRVDNPTRGIYILNNQKVMVK